MDHEQMESTIDLQELLALLWRNVFLIAGVTILLTLIVGLYTFYGIEKTYASEATLRVAVQQEDNTINYNDLNLSQKLVKTYSIIATSRTVLYQVRDDLKANSNIDLTYVQLKDSIEVTSVQDTDIISIKVTLTDPDDAATVANKVVEIFKIEVKNQVKIDTLTTLDSAVPNENAVSPNLKLNVVIGFVLGLMVSVGFVLLRAFLDRTIKNENDVEKYLKVPVLGIVPVLDKNYVK